MGMPVGAFNGSYAVYLESRMDKAARRTQQAEYESQKAFVLALLKAQKNRGKCESCGSREFVELRGQRVCSYCRSGT